jgi:predicted DNA-binding mobile mystery protein A
MIHIDNYNINDIFVTSKHTIKVIFMKPRHRQTARQQLDKTTAQFAFAKGIQTPVKGWIRAIREALGMSGTQLAQRLRVSQPRIPKLEQDELSGAVTLKTMRQVAEALDCVLIYALVPRTSLEETVRSQARMVAAERQRRVSHSMLLEAQGLSLEEQRASLDEAVDELVCETPRDLWDSKP